MGIISKNIENLKPNKEYIVTVRAKNNDINVLSEYTDSVRFRTPTDGTIPSAPTNLVLAASFLNVLFKYTDSVDEDAGKYEYELYKQDQVELISAQYQVISGETPHRTGYVQTNVFVVSVDDNSTTTSTSSTTNPVKYYGRVRTIDTAGNISGWTSIVASGDTPLIDEEFIGSLTAAKITAGTIGAHEIILTQPGTTYSYTPPANMAVIRTSNYQSGSTGWLIRGDGQAEFNNITVRGAVSGGTIDIGGSDTSSFHVDSSGNMWLGAASSGSAPFKVTSAGALTATGVTVSGQVNASSGTFSGNITATGTISGGTISGATITGSTLNTASTGNRVAITTDKITLYSTIADGSTIFFDGNSLYPSKIYSNSALILSGYGDAGWIRVGIRPDLNTGTYIYGQYGTVIQGGQDSSSVSYSHLSVTGSTQANLGLIAGSYHVQLRVGGSDVLYIRKQNDTAYADVTGGAYTNASSIKYKENIKNLDKDSFSALEKIMSLNVVEFNYKNNDNKYHGLIAEDTFKKLPEVVTLNNDGDPEGIRVMDLIAVLVAAVQEMNSDK